jgi:catechol 2,3-dioxygenase-like lactoylglutathione lyase family enzyme
MLPCTDIDAIATFFVALGFHVTHRQQRPNPYLALEGHGFDLHYYGLDGHVPEESHSTCGVVVDDPLAIWEEFAAGLRGLYGRLPIAALPRITRPRPRKNAGGHTGFSLVDPAGNWIRFMRGGSSADPAPKATSPLGTSLQNAIVLADSKGDVTQARKILDGAIRRASSNDPALQEAQTFLDELSQREPGR